VIWLRTSCSWSLRDLGGRGIDGRVAALGSRCIGEGVLVATNRA